MAEATDIRGENGGARDRRGPVGESAARVPDQRGPDERPRTSPPGHENHTPLITNRLESKALTRLPRIDAHCTYVLAYRGGELMPFQHRPKWADRAGSVRCYVVDTAPRQVHDTLKIPARVNRYSFEAAYDAQWRVADPVQVVRANVHDGDGTVTGFLRSRLGAIGRQFDPDDSAGVEAQIYTVFGAAAEAGGLPVGNGLALIALNVQVRPDQIVSERGIASDNDVHEGSLVERRTMRLRYLLDGDGSEILLHLAQNPTDTESVLRMITEARDKSEQRRLEWLDRMRADDAIQEADYEHARAAVLHGAAALPTRLDTGPFGYRPISAPPVIDAVQSTVPPPRTDNPFPPHDPRR